MILDDLINNYCLYNNVGLNATNEDFLKDKEIFKNKIVNRVNKNPINTTILADALVSRYDNGDLDFFPELSMILLKKYTNSLLKDKAINPKKLISLFGKNQELVEVPYPLLLLLGGLYYFNENDTILKESSYSKHFSRINNLTIFDLNQKYTEIYDKSELYRTPGYYEKTGNFETIKFPSVRILNRSVLPSEYSDFLFQTSEGSTVKLNGKNVIPSIGYGIQNKFLNYYNNVFFGQYLNGGTLDTNQGKPHVLLGGYLGIIKPIKTYDSDIEFTAFYRNLNVSNYNFNFDDLSIELNNITKDINLKSDDITLKRGIINSFIIFSKLKAAYLSNQFGDKNSFKLAITALCKTYNIKQNTNLCDFYYLVSHLFFVSYSEIKRENMDSFKYRLTLNESEIKPYQEKILGDEWNILNLKKSNLTEQIDSLFNFLSITWEKEKTFLNKNYTQVDNKSVFAIYPSAGGFITPNILFTENVNNNEKQSKQTLIITDKDKHTGNLNRVDQFYTENRIPTYQKDNKVGETLISVNKLVDVKSTTTAENLLTYLQTDFKTNITFPEPVKILNNPTQPKYIIESEFNRKKFLNTYTYNNHDILKNTTRFLWFDENNFGYDMLPEHINIANKNKDMFSESTDGLIYSCYSKDKISFFKNLTNNTFDLYDTLIYENDGYLNMFDFSRILDTISIDKLIEFKDEFIKFSTLNNQQNNNFNLNSLIKSSTVFGASDMLSSFTGSRITDIATNLTLTVDEVILCLIGNSYHTYEFLSKSTISKFANILLTKTQKNRYDGVVNAFSTDITTVANKTTIDSVTKIGDFQLSLHEFISSPEVLFSNSSTYDDLKINLFNELDDLTFNRYITRKILFNKQYVPNFSGISQTDRDEIYKLNEIYLFSKYHHIPLNDNDHSKIKELYFNIVSNFFIYLNIRYTKNNYLQLIKIIRTYVNYVFTKLTVGLINNNLLPNTGLINRFNFSNIINQSQKITYSNVSVNLNTTLTFFKEFNKNFYETTTQSINVFLNTINSSVSGLESENIEFSANGLNNIEKEINNLKSNTYYNIKQLYDRITTNVYTESDSILSIDKFSDIKNIDVEKLLNTKLFYNYKLDDTCENKVKSYEYDLYEIFQVVDRGNNDIGTKTIPNLRLFYDMLYIKPDESNGNLEWDSFNKLTNSTYYKLFSELSSKTGFSFHQIPNYLNLNSAVSNMDLKNDTMDQVVDDLFGVHTTTNLVGTDFYYNKKSRFGGLFGFPGFIFQIGTLESKATSDVNTKNNYYDSFCLDIGLDDNKEIIIKSDGAPNDILKSNLTCFCVDFANKNQQMFNSVQLDTTEFYSTEESINTWANYINASQTTYGTNNLFPILEKRSYSATVSGLGNATIQPLTYFYLRNTPLFGGSYWITNVSHDIRPNTMLTTFKGTRQPIVTRKDTRTQLIKLLREIKIDINKLNNEIIDESLPDTSGDILLNMVTDKPYGEISQKSDDGIKYENFDSLQVIGSYIFSVTNSNSNNDVNLLLISSLYNQSKLLLNNTINHNNIIYNMINIVIGIMKNKVISGDLRYRGLNNKISISKLIKDNSNFETDGELATLLNNISDLSFYKTTFKKIPINLKRYELICNTEGSSTLNNDNKRVILKQGRELQNIFDDINGITAFIETNDTTLTPQTQIDGVSNDDNFVTLFNLLNNNNKEYKFFGVYPTSGNNSIVFYGKPNLIWGDKTKSSYQTQSNFNGVDTRLSSGFTQYQKYPVLAGVVLKGESKTYDDYNSNKGAFIEGSKAHINNRVLSKKLTQYTISEIMDTQNKGLLFAVGRYQIVPKTLKGLLENHNMYGVSKSDLFTKEIQDKLAMGLWRKNVIKYINGSVPDTTENLNKAALDIAGEWAAVGVPYDLKVGNYGNYPVIDITKNQSLYTNVQNNRASVKTEDVQNALKYERYKINPKQGLNTTTNTSSNFNTIVIGDSIYGSVIAANPKIGLLENPDMVSVGKHLSLDVPGEGGKSLITLLKETGVNSNVKNVIVTIGSNDQWVLNIVKQKESISLLKEKYPKAKFYIMNGTYDWGSLKVTTTNTNDVWVTRINNYVNVYKNAGFEVIGDIRRISNHPSPNDAFYQTYQTKLKTFI